MPKNTQPKKTFKYTKAFKVKSVKLSLQEGIRVKLVAEALDIHPFMLSRCRKEYREGTLLGDGKKRVGVKKKKSPNAKQLTENAQLKKEIAKLKQENELLKKWQRYLAEVRQQDLDSSKDTDQ